MLDINILDGDGTGLKAHVHRFSTAKRANHSGLLVLTRPFQDFNPEVHPFLSDTFGAAMNQNIAFGGTPEIIHNGGTSVEWTGSALSGTWNFADGGKTTITSADNNDAASFAEEGATTIDMAGFTALTGKVDLDAYNSTNNSIIVAFDLAGVAVGNSIDLNDYIDTGNFAEQSFVVPKADLGLTTQLLDGMVITMTRLGGTKPTVKFDDIQFEQTGTPAVFKATTPIGTRFHITELRVALADNITGITSVADASENATVPNLAYDDFMGITSPLTNGVVFTRAQKGKTLFSVTLRQLGDFLSAGSNIVNHISDGTNTFITILVEFPEPIVLEGGPSDFLSFTISDNLSGLLQFTAAARGALEV
jgi:hypothetical protein